MTRADKAFLFDNHIRSLFAPMLLGLLVLPRSKTYRTDDLSDLRVTPMCAVNPEMLVHLVPGIR